MNKARPKTVKLGTVTIFAVALTAALSASPAAFAACVSPAGNAGDINYSTSQNIMVYCNGTNWISMGQSSSGTSFGTLTTGDFCTATSGTAVSCTTAAINMASQVTGILGAANGGTGVNNGANTLTLAGNLTTSGAFPLTLTATGTTSVTLPTSGTLITSAVTSLPSLAGIGTITTGVWNGTIISPTYGGTGVANASTSTITLGSSFATSGAYPITLTATGTSSVTLPTSGTLFSTTSTNIGTANLSATGGTGSASQFLADNNTWQTISVSTSTLTGTVQVAQGGTGDTTLTANGLLLGNGTGAVNSVGVGATGTVLIGNTGAAPTFSASPSVTNLTLSGVESLTFGTNYTTTGTQSDVAINTASSVRYTGTSTATFNGIVAGSNGQILYLHNGSGSGLTLANQAAVDTTYANQIITGTGASLTVAPNAAVTLQYDSTATNSNGASGAWRVIGGSGSGIPAGTTGQVQFNSGANTFAAGSNLSWSTANNQLVVGTGATTPVGLGTSGSVATTIMNVIPQAVTYTVTGAGGVTTNTATAGQMAYYSAANTISGSSNLYVAGSGIGIGTSGNVNSIPLTFSGASNQTIGMERGVSIGSSLTVKAGAGLAGGTNENGGNLILSSGVSTGTGSSSIQFNTYAAAGTSGASDNTATTAVTILGSGNVGIGTTAPGVKLDVNGDIRAQGGFSGTTGTGTSITYIGGTGYLIAYNAASSTYMPLQINASTVSFMNGSVGIGTANPGTLLHVYATSGNAGLIQNTGSGYYCYFGQASYSIACNGPTSGVSDQRLKKDIQPLNANEGLAAILKIQPVHYRWKDERMNVAHPEGEIGFIAQNVETALPQLVNESSQPPDAPIKIPGGKQKALQYDRISAPLVLAVQQLKSLFDTDHDMLMKMKADNDNLRKEFEDYKKMHP